MDPLYEALSFYRQRKFNQCAQICSEIISKQPNSEGQPAWVLKLRALTQQVAFDDVDVMETLTDAASAAESQWTKTARPGTSLKSSALTTAQKNKQTARPVTRPISGVVRLNRTGLPGTSSKDTAAGTRGNASQTSRLLSRLGTASIPESQTFVNVTRLNLAQQAGLVHLTKPLFEYLYFVLGDVRSALELAHHAHQFGRNNGGIEGSSNRSGATQHYWKCAIARCMVRMGLVRQVIQGSSASADWYLTSTSGTSSGTAIQAEGLLLMAKAYIIVDQPLAAIQLYRRGLDRFPENTLILTGIARIHEELAELDESVAIYKRVLIGEASHVEAVACVASHFFSTGQHELSFLLYRRLLQMGIHTAEVFCNLALCCWKTQQFDLIFPCLENAFSLLKQNQDPLSADLWDNLGHIALTAAGNPEMAALCWRISLATDRNHSQACNNLAVLALMAGRIQEGKAMLNAALNLDDELAEAKYNLELLGENKNAGDSECLI